MVGGGGGLGQIIEVLQKEIQNRWWNNSQNTYKRLTVGYIVEKPADETIRKAESALLFRKNKMQNKVKWTAKITTWWWEVPK